jgi:AraC family transcriptional regulator
MMDQSIPFPAGESLAAVAGDASQHGGSVGIADAYTAHASAECLRMVASLVAGALATLDADRGASRRYLTRASAILQAFVVHDGRSNRATRSGGGLAHWQLNRIVDYIEHHLAERITGEDLATLIDVSIGQLFRAFKVSVGIPPLQYVASRRLELAFSLMRTSSEPLSQIALTAGFCDQSHLCRVFRRVVGVTPAAWRKENAEAPASEARPRADCTSVAYASDPAVLTSYATDRHRHRKYQTAP